MHKRTSTRLLPDKWLEIYEKHIPYGMYIILGLMVTGLIRVILGPLQSLVMYLLSLVF